MWGINGTHIYLLFEKDAEINKWEISYKCKRLIVALKGNALEVVHTLQSNSGKSFWDDIKWVLI